MTSRTIAINFYPNPSNISPSWTGDTTDLILDVAIYDFPFHPTFFLTIKPRSGSSVTSVNSASGHISYLMKGNHCNRSRGDAIRLMNSGTYLFAYLNFPYPVKTTAVLITLVVTTS